MPPLTPKDYQVGFSVEHSALTPLTAHVLRCSTCLLTCLDANVLAVLHGVVDEVVDSIAVTLRAVMRTAALSDVIRTYLMKNYGTSYLSNNRTAVHARKYVRQEYLVACYTIYSGVA